MLINPSTAAALARPTRRLMVFADGENLVCRFQAMLRRGATPREGVVHEENVFVWHPTFTHLGAWHEILRATYYTSAQGDAVRLSELRKKIRGQVFQKHEGSLLPATLTPVVLKKQARQRASKGLDIRVCVDVLGHVYRGNIDAVLLLTGDGDYLPLIEEVQRSGKQVFVAAFSNGLNPKLPETADAFHDLDGTTWEPAVHPATPAAGGI